MICGKDSPKFIWVFLFVRKFPSVESRSMSAESFKMERTVGKEIFVMRFLQITFMIPGPSGFSKKGLCKGDLTLVRNWLQINGKQCTP